MKQVQVRLQLQAECTAVDTLRGSQHRMLCCLECHNVCPLQPSHLKRKLLAVAALAVPSYSTQTGQPCSSAMSDLSARSSRLTDAILN